SRGKMAKHLTLFDFSLLGTSVSDLETGTAPYRDPFLALRGAWDLHADRWSAAVTLHEMLTGLRPRYGRPGQSAVRRHRGSGRRRPAHRLRACARAPGPGAREAAAWPRVRSHLAGRARRGVELFDGQDRRSEQHAEALAGGTSHVRRGPSQTAEDRVSRSLVGRRGSG